MGKLASVGQQLYSGRVSFDFVGRRKLWYAISGMIVLFAISGLLVRGINEGVEFKGGVEFTAKIAATQDNVSKLTDAVAGSGVPEVGDPVATTSGSDAIRISTKPLTSDQSQQVATALKSAGATDVSTNLIGPSWGKQVADKALLGLVVFLVLVVMFIWAYFREWKMSVAAIVALAHDLVITVGVYAWSGFEVTPATVTGLLTILGFSLYDTVVVFDKVRENTRKFENSTTRTYSESANLAVNQTLVRSINTTITALLPVAAILVVGIVVLGTGPLKDLSLALLVGMAAGAYSSIFIATPLAVQLKGLEPAVRAHTKRVLARRGRLVAAPVAAGGPGVGGTGDVDSGGGGTVVPAPAGASTSARRATPSRRVVDSAAAKRTQPQRSARSARTGSTARTPRGGSSTRPKKR